MLVIVGGEGLSGPFCNTSHTVRSVFDRHAKSTSDPVIINSLMDVARILHDSLDSLSFIDEVRDCFESVFDNYERCVD